MQAAPVRTCVGCRSRHLKDALLRFANTPTGVRFDPQQRLPGRGAYVCPNPACIDAAGRRDGHPLRRALRTTATDDIRAALDEAYEQASSS